jgi:hypothetical protein
MGVDIEKIGKTWLVIESLNYTIDDEPHKLIISISLDDKGIIYIVSSH